MFIGHYGVSLAAKRWAPNLSLGWLFVAVQALDLVFGGLVLAGVEKMAIVPGFTAYNPYQLYFMPYSHGLLGALGWTAFATVVARGALGRGGGRAALVFGACVFSHWILDLPMHTPDLPLAGDQSTKVGFGLWRHRELSLVAELVALWLGVYAWRRATSGWNQLARKRIVIFLGGLTALLLATPFMPPPQGPQAFAISALFAYVALGVWATWVDRAQTRAASVGER
jgi:hypothetical protein